MAQEFYWFFDIQEQGPSNAGVQPHPTPFSVGPIMFSSNERININDFLKRISDSFATADLQDIAPRLYWLEAKIRQMGLLSFPEHRNTAGIVELRRAINKGQLAIAFRLRNEDNVPFTLQLGTGHHSQLHLPLGVDAPNPGETALESIPAGEFTVRNMVTPAIQVTPYCNVSATITDRPPTPPDILFVPYAGVNNKVLIMLNSSSGIREEKPIMLRDSDWSFIQTEYQSQHGATITGSVQLAAASFTLEYKNDDPIRAYEVFKIDKKPELIGQSLYPNFRDFNITANPIQSKIGPDKFSTAAAIVDTIVPNKKYWYCARSIDMHQNISNPTYIFEIEMVDNKGQMFLISKPYMADPQKQKYIKQGRQFMAIRPRTAQTIYDSTADLGTLNINQAPNDNVLGDPDLATSNPTANSTSIWGQAFKVRVTSKKTGRKIDLNLTFKNEGVVTP